MYVRQPLGDAVAEVLNILGRPSAEWPSKRELDENEKGQQWEVDEAIYTLRAALGQPVPRQVCKVCQARDSIWWERDPANPPSEWPTDEFWCHSCGAIAPDSEWISEVV